MLTKPGRCTGKWRGQVKLMVTAAIKILLHVLYSPLYFRTIIVSLATTLISRFDTIQDDHKCNLTNESAAICYDVHT